MWTQKVRMPMPPLVKPRRPKRRGTRLLLPPTWPLAHPRAQVGQHRMRECTLYRSERWQATAASAFLR